jgi:hypothetical protein
MQKQERGVASRAIDDVGENRAMSDDGVSNRADQRHQSCRLPRRT